MKKSERENAVRRRLFVLVGAIVVIIIVLIIVMVSKPDDDSNQSDNSALINKGANKNIENIEVEKDEDSEINILINEYYSALVAGDKEKLSTLIYDADGEEFIEQKIIESYNNISVYSVKGLKDNEYVVFAYWESKFINIETPASGIEAFYVVKDGDKYLIDKELSEEEKAYIQAVSENEEIKKLFHETNEKLMDAINSDTNLKALYDLLLESTSEETSSSEDGSSEETSSQESSESGGTTATE